MANLIDLSGSKWLFKQPPTPANSVPLPFKSDYDLSIQYTGIIYVESMGLLFGKANGAYDTVWTSSSGWKSYNYRYITFGTISDSTYQPPYIQYMYQMADYVSGGTFESEETEPTTEEYLQTLINQKKALANNLVTQGVEASEDEKFNTLIPKVLDIQTGGGSTGDGKYRIRYFDIDGTILKEEYLNEGDSLTPPDNPSYDSDYLVFDSWNYDIENTVVDGNLDIGAIYNTIDNCTYMFCRFTTITGLNPSLRLTGTPTIDWGDGTINTSLSHTYANEGEYIIKISGSFSFDTDSPTYAQYLFSSSNLNKSLNKIYISSNITKVSASLLYMTHSLKIVSIPNSVIDIGNVFIRSYSIKCLIIPSSVKTYGNNANSDCRALKILSLPNTITSMINQGLFSNLYALESAIIPNNMTTLPDYAVNNCYSLKSIIIPKNIVTIEDAAFYGSETLTNCFILCDQVPTLGGTNAFYNINKSCIMWVNDSIIEDLKVATNWSTYASYMKPLSEYRGDYYD